MMNKYGGKIPERDVNCYTQMILEGLLDVYEKGFIHSDRKLGNILAFPPQHGTHLPTLKIVDFRLAKQQGVKDTRFGFQGRSPWDTHDRDDLRDKLLMGESPNILEDMSKLGNSFLRECFTINPNKRWNASKLLCHPYLLLSEHMLPKDNQQSLPYFQQQKVLESQNIPPLLGFNIPNKI
ncbi:mitogen-activated protein kinase kinase kinase 20-like [Gossypium raimondii]|uniref:mitogen-activated protein kinase kinase kinase 20-like n=1 Tax=Gossypium raimondii TaxID=29730 RepID=UPI00227AF64A|nr:mitogen-activated protein kinase kinase kinase 20-like [Gossypium raimondii]